MAIIIWSSLAVLLTIAIYSFLFKDNPVYKFAEHVFIGLNVGYFIVTDYKLLIPRLFIPLRDYFHQHNWVMFVFMLMAAILGMLYLSRFSEKNAWLSRFPIAIVTGYYTGYSLIPTFQTNIMEQLYGTVIDNTSKQPLLNGEKFSEFFNNPTFGSFIDAFNGPILVIGVLLVLVYFFFSLKHTNPIVRFSTKPALLFIMISFGAAFGYTFMGRISLFIGRMNYIFGEWLPLFTK